MLFHPRQPIHLFGRRVPFTPGLIPKRKLDIAGSLGDVVSEYLVTSDGLRVMLRQRRCRSGRRPAWRAFSTGCWRTIARCANGRARLHRHSGPELCAAWGERLVQADRVGKPARLGGQRLGRASAVEFLPAGQEESLTGWAGKAASAILLSIERDLLSSSGLRMLLRMAKEFVDESKGFMGVDGAIFVDEDKLVTRITPLLAEQLRSDKVHETVTSMLEAEAGGVAEPAAGRAAARLVGRRVRACQPVLSGWRSHGCSGAAAWNGGETRGRAAGWRRARRLGSPTCRGSSIPRSRCWTAIWERSCVPPLEEVVRSQVEQFPIERLETIILSVSGRVPCYYVARGAAWWDYRFDSVADSTGHRLVALATAAAPVWYAD